MHQRPIPVAAEDIGTWQTIFLILSIISVVTNAGLICFTMDTFDDYENKSIRLWVFILFQWVCFIIQFSIMAAIPDIPEEILIQQDRQKFIVSKLIDKIADDDNESVKTEIVEVINFEEYPKFGGVYEKDHGNLLFKNMK